MKAGQKINMKYLIIGAGGTGGVTGYYMKKAGKDVTLIARGEHLKKIQKQGLTLEKMWDKTEENISIPATMTAGNRYREKGIGSLPFAFYSLSSGLL